MACGVYERKRGDVMAYLSKLPYGLRREGEIEKLIHISEILPSEFGLKCDCVCPNCNVRLQAKLPRYKKDYTARFTHHNSDTCDYATETALHMKAKEIIETERSIKLPEVLAEYKGLTKLVYSERNVTFDTVMLEKWIDNIRPDIFAYKGMTPLIIEIKVSHGIDNAKLEKIKKHKISTLEIVHFPLQTIPRNARN